MENILAGLGCFIVIVGLVLLMLGFLLGLLL